MITPSEEVTKTWLKEKGIILKNRPQPSRFSFLVCLTMVISIALGFLGGFITAGFALSENYSTVYENLLVELKDTRSCLEREKELFKQNNERIVPHEVAPVNHANARININNSQNQIQEQAIFSAFSHAVERFQKNDKIGGCDELNNIINLTEYGGKWKTKANYLIDKNCR